MREKQSVVTEIGLEKSVGLLLLLIILAYMFSMGIRMYWPLHFADNASMMYAGELMINTNDGYFFSTGARDVIDGVIALDKQRASAYNVSPGLVLLTAYLTQFTPFSLDTVSLYLPGLVASLIVIPIILTGRLMGNTFLGFFAALLGSIAWSYYNRTMIGYYDTDMFSVLMQFMVFYSFLYVVYKKSALAVLFSVFMMFIYPYFYSQGMTLVYAMFFLLVVYLVLEDNVLIKTESAVSSKDSLLSIYSIVILLSVPLMITLSIELRMALFLILAIILLWNRIKFKETHLLYMAILFFIGFLIFSNIFMVIWSKVVSYGVRGLDSGSLQFYQVVQTVREAGAIPFEMMANRISGSQVGVILSLIGYVLLVNRHKVFLIALPLIGVGVFSMWGGLRFTVYAVPIAALSAIYLFYILGDFVKESVKNEKAKNPSKYIFIVLATAVLIYPNIKHIQGYLVPTVLNKMEVNDLVKLDEIASDQDYTLAWWDYGYPIWYYSNTNTLIDGGKHTHDNYIVSKLMFSDSPQQVANLSKLAIETYVDSNYAYVADTLFNNTDKSPNAFLRDLKRKDYILPNKTRDVYLYLPYRMLNIFPTVGVFGNLNLKTGKAERKIHFYPAKPVQQEGSKVLLQNGIIFDYAKGEIELQGTKKRVQRFDTVVFNKENNSGVNSQFMHMNGDLVVIFLKSYNQMVVMDTKTYKSTYVQMFMLENYDKNLFELVVSSPYSKIYKIK